MGQLPDGLFWIGNQPFAFGPYIAIAGWIALLWGDQIAKAYLGG